MRLIDADALKIDYIVPSTTTGTPCYLYISKEQIDCAPTIEAEPVHRGRWLETPEEDNVVSGICSVCGWEAEYYADDVAGMPYCPNCGAKMEGDDGE